MFFSVALWTSSPKRAADLCGWCLQHRAVPSQGVLMMRWCPAVVPRQVITQAIRVRMMGGMMVSYVVVALQQKTSKVAGGLRCGRASPAAVTSR